MEKARGKSVTLFLETWQMRMISDLTSKGLRAGLGRRDLSRLILTKGRIFCPQSYKISPEGFRRDDYEIYLTDEQMRAVKHEFGLRKAVTTLHISSREIENGIVQFAN